MKTRRWRLINRVHKKRILSEYKKQKKWLGLNMEDVGKALVKMGKAMSVTADRVLSVIGEAFQGHEAFMKLEAITELSEQQRERIFEIARRSLQSLKVIIEDIIIPQLLSGDLTLDEILERLECKKC